MLVFINEYPNKYTHFIDFRRVCYLLGCRGIITKNSPHPSVLGHLQLFFLPPWAGNSVRSLGQKGILCPHVV